MNVYEHQAQYYETDQMGIIHHSNYIRWMESARIWWMKEQGVDYKELERAGIISPVLEVSCQYKTMVHFEDTVLIELKIEKYNGVKLELSYRITDKETGELRSIGSSKHCFLNKDGAPVSLKKAYPEFDRAFSEGINKTIE
ncbi:MAG: acyl-CoA thioesterase [Lachnospiraceae bacterium]|nr:acyl-CoA thioesterase [Lachnospiraceae bacterium]